MRGKLRTFEPYNLPPNNLSMLNLIIKPCEIIKRYSKKAGPGNTPGSASVLNWCKNVWICLENRKNCCENIKIEGRIFYQNMGPSMLRVTGFEPAASCSQSRRATNCATPGYLVLICCHCGRDENQRAHGFEQSGFLSGFVEIPQTPATQFSVFLGGAAPVGKRRVKLFPKGSALTAGLYADIAPPGRLRKKRSGFAARPK